MDYFEKIFDEINHINRNMNDKIRLILEPVYDSFLSNLVNRIRNDAGNYDEIEELSKVRKKISNESKRQYKIIISFCRQDKKDDLKIALEK